MKARLTLAVCVILAGLLGSCQQAFVDKQARESGDPFSASFPAPTGNPQDVPGVRPPIPDAASMVPVTVATVTQVWSNALGLINEIGPNGGMVASIAATPGLPGFRPLLAKDGTTVPGSVPGSGLSGYIPTYPSTTASAYDITTTSTPLYSSNESQIGDSTVVVQNYQENSPDYNSYYSSGVGVQKLYKKAIHRLFKQTSEGTFDNWSTVGSGPYIAGRFSSKLRGEWLKDINVSDTNSYSAYQGFYEASVSWVMTVVYQDGEDWVAGKVVAKLAGTKQYSYGSYTEVPDNQLYAYYDIKVYDFDNKLVWSNNTSSAMNYAWPYDYTNN